jgi:hypothetical protein
VLVDQQLMVLTVDHLIPELADKDQEDLCPIITHVSEQDHVDLMAPVIKEFIAHYTSSSSHVCGFCAWLCYPRIANFDLMSSLVNLNGRFMASDLLLCPLYQEIKLKYLSDENPISTAMPLARLHRQSGQGYTTTMTLTSEGSQLVQREMDWALFEILDHEILGETLMNRAMKDNGMGATAAYVRHRYLHQSAVQPEAFIKSLGRTSGYQVGQISNTASMIFHGPYQTQEWCVMRRLETAVDDWIEGGIGVDGDSGGLIVDESTNALYGMLWGRSGEGPQTITLFTPLTEIFNDIAERHNVRVDLLWGQEMPQHDTKTRRENTILSSEVESVPITMVLDDVEQNIALEQSTPTPGVRRLSSIEVGHRPFERYRGQDRLHHSVPRSMATPRDEDVVQGGQYPGSYVYSRYALEQEKKD